MAADSQEQDLYLASEKGNDEKCFALLEAGADPTYQNAAGMSPLMIAAENGHARIVQALLEAGAPWNAQDKEGYTAGEYALGGKHQEILQKLLEWGVKTEMVLGAAARHDTSSGLKAVSNASYLQQKLRYEGEVLIDEDGEAVMMGWERPLMERHAQLICGTGGDILNVGFGLGIIDTCIQGHQPRSHTIIEAHPDVFAHMVEKGWTTRPGVRVLFGRWQDVLSQLGQYDGIFFDTYGGYYEELHLFQKYLPRIHSPTPTLAAMLLLSGEYYEELHLFQKELPRILRPGGIYSFFNGLASDNIFFHMVYSRLIQLELEAEGITTEYQPVKMDPLQDKVWEGIKNKYWHFDVYFLPVCRRNLLPDDALQPPSGTAGK